MTEVSRAGWLDSHKTNCITEQIVKEAKYRNAATEKDLAKELAQLEAAEAAAAASPPPPPPEQKTYQPPDTSKLTQRERDTRLANELGKNMWRKCNPGYMSGTMNVQSQSKLDFQYDPSELEPVNRQNFRRRDTFTNYVEAAAKYNNIMKKTAGGL